MTADALPARTADPYRDTDVIDARAPRFNQAVVGLLAVLAVATGWWPILALVSAQLGIGLVFGRRWCVTCVVYFEIIQPTLGEGPIEDARPPRFANLIGFVVLGAAALAYAGGLLVVGAALGSLVAVLALLAASTGLCVGCEMYRIGARLRAIRAHAIDRIDPADLDRLPDGSYVVEFTHPLCTDCRTLERRLVSEGWSVVSVDVKRRPELARKYGVEVVPTAVAVDSTGRVTRRIAG